VKKLPFATSMVVAPLTFITGPVLPFNVPFSVTEATFPLAEISGSRALVNVLSGAQRHVFFWRGLHLAQSFPKLFFNEIFVLALRHVLGEGVSYDLSSFEVLLVDDMHLHHTLQDHSRSMDIPGLELRCLSVAWFDN
jgi:hypothetical protein